MIFLNQRLDPKLFFLGMPGVPGSSYGAQVEALGKPSHKPKTGSDRAKNTANKMLRCWFFFFFNVIMGFLGVVIIPKWLIHDF